MSAGDGAGSRVDLARSVWERVEAYHAVIYFAPEKKDAYEAAGLKGGWMGYFASRAAALGPVSAEVVHACFYNFHKDMVRRSIPDAWAFSTPERVLAARYDAAARALGRLLGDASSSHEVSDALDIARRATAACDMAGRPMFAAHAALPWPDVPYVALWHACTLLREHRGDAHVHALMAAEIDGCEAHVLRVAHGEVPADVLRSNRGWSEEEWGEAVRRLQGRGLVDADAQLTPDGERFASDVERDTSRLASAPWSAIGTVETSRLIDALDPLVAAIIEGDGLPFPNPMVLTRPPG